MLTGSQIEPLLTYDPLSGEFHWKRSRGGRKAGSRAGHLQTFKESGKKYWVIRIHNQLILASRLAWAFMKGEWAKEVDHKDGDSTNDIFSNLRSATHSQNMSNTHRRRDNKSGYKGVSWDEINKKWVVRIRVPNGRYENLGRFSNAAEGHQAYCARATELYGEFARFE